MDVREGGDAAIGVYGEEIGGLLLVVLHVDVVGFVGETVRVWLGRRKGMGTLGGHGGTVPELLERDGYFDAIGGLSCVKVKVGCW